MNSAGFDAPEVLILCRDCDGKRAWFAVERGNRGYGKALLWRAAKRGDRILTGRLVPDTVSGSACSCPEKGLSR